MTDNCLERLLCAFQIDCNGIDYAKTPVLNKDQIEPVIVKVYKTGESIPLCRYLVENKICSSELDRKKYGICPYFSK